MHKCSLTLRAVFLGCSLLALLLQRQGISKIYLLNRKGSTTQRERHAAGFQSRGLDPSILELKGSIITYLDVDFSKGDLGLAKEAYEEVSPHYNTCVPALTENPPSLLFLFFRYQASRQCHTHYPRRMAPQFQSDTRELRARAHCRREVPHRSRPGVTTTPHASINIPVLHCCRRSVSWPVADGFIWRGCWANYRSRGTDRRSVYAA